MVIRKYNKFFEKEIYLAKEFEFRFGIENYSAVTEGQWMPTHSHLGTDDFATIHYLNFKKDHSLTTFYNPAKFAQYIKYLQPKLYNTLGTMVPDNSYLWDFFSFPVGEDDVLIFPAALDHEVKMQGPTKEPRITISTNISIDERVD